MTEKRQNNLDIRDEVLADDAERDVGVCFSVTVGVTAAVSAILGALAVIIVITFSRFRPEIHSYWMACVPFIFPGITGVAVAYKRQSFALSLHVPILLIALLTGGSGYGHSVEPIFLQNSNCTDVYDVGSCNRPIMLYLYMAAGGAAAAVCVLGMLIAFCACCNTNKRIARRRKEREETKMREDATKKLESQQAKREAYKHPAPITIVSEKPPIGNDVIVPPSNGVHPVNQGDVTRL